MRSLRIFLTFLALAGITLLVLIAALYLLVTPERIRAQSIAVAQENFGLTLELPLPTEIRHLPTLSFTFDQVRACSTGSPSSNVISCAELGRTVVELNPFAIFTPSPRLSLVDIENLTVELDQTAHVRNFFEGLSKSGWNLEHFALRDATIRMGGDTPLELQGVALSAFDLSEAGAKVAWRAQVKSDILSGDTSGEADFDWSTPVHGLALEDFQTNFLGLHRQTEWRSSLTGKHLVWNGTECFGTEIHLDAKTDNDAQTVSIVLPTFKYDQTKTEAEGASAKLVVESTDGRWEASLSGDFLKSESTTWDNLIIRSSLHGNGVNAAPCESEMRGRLVLATKDNPGEAIFKGFFFGTPITLNARIFPSEEESSPTRVVGDLTTGVLRAAPFGMLRWPPEFFTRWNWHGRIDIAGIEELPTVHALHAEVALTDGTFSFTRLQGEVLGGTADGALHIDRTGAWSAAVRVRNAQADTLFRKLPDTALSGRVNLDAALSGRLTEEHKLDTIEGTVILTDGAFAGLDLHELTTTLLADQPEEPPSAVLSSKSATTFQTLGVHFAKSGSAPLSFSEGQASGDGWEACFTGETNGQIEFQATFKIAPHALEPGFELPAIARWKANTIHWSVDWPTALQTVRNVKGEPPLTFDGILRRAERAVEDFWNSFELPEWIPFGHKNDASETL